MAAWRGTEDNPFHTEVGYWLWDATDGQVMRCFMIPRGSALIAGSSVASEATANTLTSDAGSETYGILSNQFLAVQARTDHFEVDVDVSEDGVFRYEEVSLIGAWKAFRAPEPNRQQYSLQDQRRLTPIRSGAMVHR